MQQLILVILCCVVLWDPIVQSLELPSFARFLPEALSVLVMLYVLIAGTRDRFRLVAPKYWLVFAALALVILAGIINSNPGAGPLISGLRLYLRALPLFFLAAAFPMTDQQLATQLKVLLGLALVQLPFSLYQRWVVMSEGRYSGDFVTGTLLDSGIESMFLICAALVLTGLLLKHRIGGVRFLLMFLLILFPTTINETKVTAIFLPLGLLVTLFVGAEPGKRLRYAGIAAALLIVFGAIFVPIYNKMEEHDPDRVDIVDFFTDPQKLDRYLAAHGNLAKTGIGGTKEAHRGQALDETFGYLAKDPVRLAFGLGLGNVSPSQAGKEFEGSYYQLFRNLLVSSFIYFVLELGVLGVLLIGVLLWMVFSDSLAVARADDSLTGALGAGWTGVVAIFAIGMVYDNYHFFAAPTFLYWYFSGVVCARRMALRYSSARIPRTAVQPA